MTADYICRCAAATAKVYGIRDAEKIFEIRGADIKEKAPLGYSGIIYIENGILTVFPPEESLKDMRKISMAHMLGHMVLHRERLFGGKKFEDNFFIKNENHEEKEADIFAAEMLIADDDIKNLERLGFTEGQIASSLGALRPLVSCKIYSMRCRGISVCGTSYREDFMRKYDIEVVI